MVSAVATLTWAPLRATSSEGLIRDDPDFLACTGPAGCSAAKLVAKASAARLAIETTQSTLQYMYICYVIIVQKSTNKLESSRKLVR